MRGAERDNPMAQSVVHGKDHWLPIHDDGHPAEVMLRQELPTLVL
jgi:hypothetical protein